VVQKKISLITSHQTHKDYSDDIHTSTPSFLQHQQSTTDHLSISPRNEAEKKRHELRQALANRLRFDLVQQEEEKECKSQFDRLASFNSHLKAAETHVKQLKEQEKATKELVKRQQTILAHAIQNSKLT